MSDLPCKNPSCKSEGQSHPNCRCYTGLAKGGQIKHFCDTNNRHLEDCKYYADGGTALPEGFTLDQPTSPNTNQSQATTPPSDSTDLPQGFTLDQSTPTTSDTLPDGFTLDSDKYGTTGQQIATGVEGAAEGFLSKPVTVGIEKGLNKLGVPGVSDQDITGREATNPTIHSLSEAGGLTAGLLTGTGEAGIIAHGIESIPLLAKLGEGSILAKAGAGALKGMIQGGLFQSGDEIGNAMIGQGDPQAPVSSALANIGAAGLFGGALGGASSLVSSGIGSLAKSISSSPLDNTKAASFMAGIGSKASPQEFNVNLNHILADDPDVFHQGAFNLGQKAYDILQGQGARVVKDYAGYELIRKQFPDGIVGDAAAAFAADKAITPLINSLSIKAGKYALPVIMKVLTTENLNDMNPVFRYSNNVAKGAQKVTNAIEALFKSGGQQAIELDSSDRRRQQIKDYVENGSLNQQMQNQLNQPTANTPQYAEGGAVESDVLDQETDPVARTMMRANRAKRQARYDQTKEDQFTPSDTQETATQNVDPISQVYPEQAMLLGTAKARVNGYLNSIRPQSNQPKLAFDKSPVQTVQNREYDKAIAIADQPLSVLNKVKNGTLMPNDVKHLNAMYPEVHDLLNKKLTERITKAQLAGETPSYRTRQSLSLLMGTPLDSTLTPQSIQAAQAVYMNKDSGPQNPPVTKVKKNTSKLGEISKSYQTANDSAITRQQTEK